MNMVSFPAAVYCTIHTPPSRSAYDYLGDESARRVDISEPEEKTPIECRTCPVCHHPSLLRLCYFHWLTRPAQDCLTEEMVDDYTLKTKHVCDSWACFVCGARVREDRVHLPEQHDLRLEDFKDG